MKMTLLKVAQLSVLLLYKAGTDSPKATHVLLSIHVYLLTLDSQSISKELAGGGDVTIWSHQGAAVIGGTCRFT